MSLYAVDKLLWSMSHREDKVLFTRYLDDPASVLEGADLTAEERRAFFDFDFGALYAMGAQPFILWGWARAVSRARGADLEAFTDQYIETVKPFGNPDFST